MGDFPQAPWLVMQSWAVLLWEHEGGRPCRLSQLCSQRGSTASQSRGNTAASPLQVSSWGHCTVVSVTGLAPSQLLTRPGASSKGLCICPSNSAVPGHLPSLAKQELLLGSGALVRSFSASFEPLERDSPGCKRHLRHSQGSGESNVSYISLLWQLKQMTTNLVPETTQALSSHNSRGKMSKSVSLG